MALTNCFYGVKEDDMANITEIRSMQKTWYFKLLMIKSEVGLTSKQLVETIAELESAMEVEDMAHVREIVNEIVGK